MASRQLRVRLLASPPLQVCTIIAKNYVAHARVLARSLAASNPGIRLWTLVIDELDGWIDPDREPFRTLTPQEIGCAPFTAMALRYSVLELSTAVKPWLLRHLIQTTGEPVTYLDPDIEVFGSLEQLDRLAGEHALVLIPHNTAPIPADGRSPSQLDVMIAGIYNLGYVSVARSAEIDRLLDWWSERLQRDCRVDPVWGYFVDQRWFDLAPGFVSDLAIVRDPEYNLAYWNLNERRLGRQSTGWTVNGRPLAFFHFSGFDPDHPLVLSRHQDRVDVSADPALRELLASYARRVLAEGHAESRHWPYSYGALGDGTVLDRTLRGLYDEYEAQLGAGAPSPFTLAGARAFQAWVAAQAPGGPPGVSRALLHVYQRRADLSQAYTTPAGPDGAGLIRWARDYGEVEEPLLYQLMRSHGTPGDTGHEAGESIAASPPEQVRGELLATAPQWMSEPPDTVSPLRRDPFGVNVVGYFRSELGTGEAARQMVSALDSRRIAALPIHGHTIPISRQNHPYETASPEEAPFPVNLICMNADMLPEFARQVGSSFFARRWSIGLWFWEVGRFPERWRDSFSLLEEVWAPTEHVARALEPLATVPVTTVRLPVAPSPLQPRSRAALGLEQEAFTFLFSYDYLSVAERKNPLAAIAAFSRAFAPGDGARLIVKCINSERDLAYHERVLAGVGERHDIKLIDGYMSPTDNRSLSVACDCYVSLHRAEGFGLGMAEAMWNGKPVIATGYSGNLDFMTESNSLLVDHELVRIGEGFDPYPADGVWAQPSVEHAAALMRRVFDDRELAARLGTTAAAEI
ncbi:MAG: glycosyltransferase family 4 protein, partial [Solirubrobacteraceae bacterium]